MRVVHLHPQCYFIVRTDTGMALRRLSNKVHPSWEISVEGAWVQLVDKTQLADVELAYQTYVSQNELI